MLYAVAIKWKPRLRLQVLYPNLFHVRVLQADTDVSWPTYKCLDVVFLNL